MKDIAVKTGGAYTFSAQYSPKYTTEALKKTMPGYNRLTVLEETVTLEEGERDLGVYIDSTIGLNTFFSCTFLRRGGGGGFKVLDPTGVEIQSPDPFNVQVEDAREGLWRLTTTTTTTTAATITTTTTPRPTTQPDIRVWSSASTMTPLDLTSQPLTLHALVTLGGVGVTGLEVKGMVNSGEDIEVILFDDGYGDPDMRAGDGVYSGYVIDYTGGEEQVAGLAGVTITPASAASSSTRSSSFSSSSRVMPQDPFSPGFCCGSEVPGIAAPLTRELPASTTLTTTASPPWDPLDPRDCVLY
ncbi:uncharacterized protein LOC123501369 [Portunus trituberculatus]|uniref:uncharacterized protein LOC123501369 n=1 Tax=Portunus trituberculatus TaxID=210409 RepID=UPI001E1D1E99|nr:uncharacterized protein LOC123501369 [Portunus trituberculatus]